MKEIEIKKLLTKHILSSDSDVNIGAEVPFNFGSRRADIVSLRQGLATAYEIKGLGDNTGRLDSQVESYKQYFDYCFIVCEEENLSLIRKAVGKEIGILLASKDGIQTIRKSKQFKRHSKESLANTLTISGLKRLANNKNLRSKHDLVKYVSHKYTLDAIRDLARQELDQRYAIVTSLLKQDTTQEITSDDILTITRMPPRELILRS